MPKRPKISISSFENKLMKHTEHEIEANTETQPIAETQFKSKIQRKKGEAITDEMLRLFVEQTELEHEGDIYSAMEMYKGFGRPNKYGNMSRISTASAANMLGITPYELKCLAKYLEPNIDEIRDDTIKPWYDNIRKATGVDETDEPKYK